MTRPAESKNDNVSITKITKKIFFILEKLVKFNLIINGCFFNRFNSSFVIYIWHISGDVNSSKFKNRSKFFYT